jgi:hypothetical protein
LLEEQISVEDPNQTKDIDSCHYSLSEDSLMIMALVHRRKLSRILTKIYYKFIRKSEDDLKRTFVIKFDKRFNAIFSK